LGSPVIQKKIPPREVAPIKSEYSFDSPKDDKSEELKKQVEHLFKRKQEREADEEKAKANHGQPSQEVTKITNKKEKPEEDEYDYDFD